MSIENSEQEISEKYQDLIEKVYECTQTDHQFEQNRQEKLPKIIKKIIIQRDSRTINGKMKVISDRKIGVAICKNIQQLSSKYIETGKNDFSLFKRRVDFNFQISRILNKEKFLLNKDFRIVEKEYKAITSTKQYMLEEKLKLLEGSQDQEEFRQDFFDTVNLQYNETMTQEEIILLYTNFYTQALSSINRTLLIKLDFLITKFQGTTQMIEPQIRNKVEQILKDDIGIDDRQIRINKYLKKLAIEQSLQANLEHKQKIEELYEYIKSILNKFSGLKILKKQLKLDLYLAKFGSNVSGFASKNTDMDLTILTNNYISQKQLLSLFYRFLEAELHQKFKHFNDNVKNIYQLDLIESARIPLVKLKFKKYKGLEIHFDIIVNNILGVVNSKFLSIYASVPWIKDLGILVKMWGKNRQLISQSKFSSYSVNLLLLHFLLETDRMNLIMDARTREHSAPHFLYKRKMKDDFQSFNVYYMFKQNAKDVTNLKRVSYIDILAEFFNYYKPGGQHWKLTEEEQIITVDGSKMKQFDKQYIFTMKDPFDEKHNPGRVRQSDYNNIMKQFENAARIMEGRCEEEIRYLFMGTINQ